MLARPEFPLKRNKKNIIGLKRQITPNNQLKTHLFESWSGEDSQKCQKTLILQTVGAVSN